jgi:hypothetical protein
MTLFFACVWPFDEAGNARGRYDRRQGEYTIAAPITTSWNIGTEGGIGGGGWQIYTLAELGLAAYPGVRLMLDEAAVTDYTPPGPPIYSFPVDPAALPPGHHVMRIEARSGDWFCSNVLFHTGPPIPLDEPHWIQSAPTKFDKTFAWAVYSDRAVKVWYPGFVPTPKTSSLPPRIAEPYNTILPASQLWVTRMSVCIPGGLARRFTRRQDSTTGLPRVGNASYQQYHYYDSRGDWVPLVDGDRGVSALGHVVAGRVAANGSLYWLATNGRVGWTGTNGKTLTIAGRHRKSGPSGTHLSPTPSLQPYWQSGPDIAASMEWMADWKTPGMAQYFREPWDLAFWEDPPAAPAHPLILFTDTQPMTGAMKSPTGIGRVCMMDHTPVHTGGLPPVWEIWKHPVPDAQPWGIDRGPDGRYYVTCCMTHEIWALEIAVDGTEPSVSPRLVSAERVFRSALTPTLGALGMSERFEQQSTVPIDTLRATYNKDGAFGTASLIFPQSIRFLSDGTAIVACRYTFTLHRIDFRVGTVQLFGRHNPPGSRDWSLDVNKDGTTGPKDLIRGLTWYMDSDGSWLPTGAWGGRFLPKGNSIADMQVVEGPADKHIGVSYPWFVASGGGCLYLGGTGAMQGCWLVTKRQATDPAFNITLYTTGRNAYRYPPDRTPSFTLSHGDEFQGQLGLPVPDELAAMADADLAAYWRAGLGTGIPRNFTDAQIAGLLYYTRWNAVRPAGPLPPDTTPPTAPTRLTLKQATWR